MLLSVVGLLASVAVLVLLHTPRASRRMKRMFRRSRQVRFSVILGFAVIGALSAIVLTLQVVSHDHNFDQTLAVLALLVLTTLVVYLLEMRMMPVALDPAAGRVLAIGAHPDDLELGCGATLARLVDAGYEVRGMVMSRGAVGGKQELRVNEARVGGELLGLHRLDVHDFPDTQLSESGNGMIEVIESVIKEWQPTTIFTHSAHDQHQDHVAVHTAVIRAGRRHPSILCFESPSATRSFNPSVFVEISEYVDIKVSAVELHRDQAGKPYMTGHQIRGIAAFRGSQAKCQLAEAFEPTRYTYRTRAAI